MIYDSNDMSILFLPDKKINYWQYRNMINQKLGTINRNGGDLTSLLNKKHERDKYSEWAAAMLGLFCCVSIPANIVAAALVKSVAIYLLLIPLLLLIPIASCICTGINTAQISKMKKYNVVCIGYLHRGYTVRGTANVASSPLYRLETANGPMFVHCVLGTLYRKFPNIGQVVSLYISDEGPNECYADNQKVLLIVSLICLGVNILFIFIMILVKIM